MTARSLISAALLDDKPEVEPATTPDVLDCIAGPDRSVRDTFPVEEVGDLTDRALGEIAPDTADDGRFVIDDDELPRVDEDPGVVPGTAVSEGIVTPVATVFEQSSLHADHPLGVLVPLELGGEADLAEHEPTSGTVKTRPRERGDEQRHLMAVELVAKVEHEPRISVQSR